MGYIRNFSFYSEGNGEPQKGFEESDSQKLMETELRNRE